MTSGGLIVDKPEGWTSHDVVARVRRLAGTRRVGHTGTLDPFATGVLVVCVGAATRLSQLLVGCEKQYDAVMRLGWATDTQDRTGERIGDVAASEVIPDDAALLSRVLEEFSGEIEQLREPGRRADAHDEDAGRERVERPGVPDAPRAGEPAYARHHVVRRPPFRLVDDQSADRH